eukprot:gene8979-10634_t
MAGRAPELLLGNRPTAAADVWELACVLYFIFTGKTSPYVPSGVQLPEALLNELIAAGDLDIATLEGALATGQGSLAACGVAMCLVRGVCMLAWQEEPRIMRLAEEDAALLAEAEPILELGAEGSWRGRVPEALLQEKEQYSYYNTGRMADLLRFVRNVYEHPPEVGSDAWNSVKLASSSSGRSHRGGHSRRILTEVDHASWKKAVAYSIVNNSVPELPLIVYKWKARGYIEEPSEQDKSAEIDAGDSASDKNGEYLSDFDTVEQEVLDAILDA